MLRIIVFLLFLGNSLLAQSGGNVLVEFFTANWCPPCVQAHFKLEDYLENGSNKDKIIQVHYHLSDEFYNDAPLSIKARRDYYFGPNSTVYIPHLFFDGEEEFLNYEEWNDKLDNFTSNKNNCFFIQLNQEHMAGGIKLNVKSVTLHNAEDNDLKLHIFLVETFDFDAQNGIKHHKNVLRKLITPSDGQPYDQSASFNQDYNLYFDPEGKDYGIIAFIQSYSTRKVYTTIYKSLGDIESDISQESSLPQTFYLNQNYPNPFNPETNISFKLPERSFVNLKVYDVTGREVKTLVERELNPGNYNISFNGNYLSSGVYFYRLTTNNFTAQKKMILMK